tara:strand:- start:163 stop:597 length:435 start_codon:yes stop_codon:yes gene_type:complete
MSGDELKRTVTNVVNETSKTAPTVRRIFKIILLVFGCINVGIGTVGLVVPGLPTTIFLIIALWAFSQSSDRFHRWLYNHRLFGPSLRKWTEQGAIPNKAKGLAVLVMCVSWVVIFYSMEHWAWPVFTGALMISVIIYILSRPSH